MLRFEQSQFAVPTVAVGKGLRGTSVELEQTDTVPVSALKTKRFQRFRFLFRLLEERFRRFEEGVKAFLLRFLDFPGAVRALEEMAETAAEALKRPILVDFQAGRVDPP